MKVTNLFTAQDREVFDRIDRDCLAMHVMPPPKTFLKLDVADSQGKIVEVYEDRAHSWNRNAYNTIMSVLAGCKSSKTGTFGAGSLSGKSYLNAVMSNANYLMAPDAGNVSIYNDGKVGASNAGIVIGTGNAAESFDGFVLAAPILSGTASGQMSYEAGSEATIDSYDSVAKKMTVKRNRVFNNNSGASIIVAETGIYVQYGIGTCMKCRDVLASPVTVPNAGQLTVTYTIEMTFPA